MKGIIIASLILLAGLATAYTPEQQTTLDGMNLSFQLGIAYDKALQGQNIAEYNILVDEYNAWVRLHFAENTSLLKSKLNEPAIGISPIRLGAETAYLTKPFNASSDLSKFGKQEAYVANPEQMNENAIARLEQEMFLNT